MDSHPEGTKSETKFRISGRLRLNRERLMGELDQGGDSDTGEEYNSWWHLVSWGDLEPGVDFDSLEPGGKIDHREGET